MKHSLAPFLSLSHLCVVVAFAVAPFHDGYDDGGGGGDHSSQTWVTKTDDRSWVGYATLRFPLPTDLATHRN